MVIVTATATLLAFRLAMALAFALVMIAAFSYLSFRLLPRKAEGVSVEPRRIAAFKLEKSRITLRLRIVGKSWLNLRILSVRMPQGVDCEIEFVDNQTSRVLARPRYAGRFSGFGVEIELSDPLGIFAETEEINVAEFAVEAFPLALLAPARRLMLPAITMGELPAGRRGTGQEVYSVEAYQPAMDTRDILWKRVAQMPDESLVAKAGESNVLKELKVGLIEVADRGAERPRWMDEVTESVAQLGKSLLEIGIQVVVLKPTSQGRLKTSAVDIGSLTRSVMEMWKGDPGTKGLEAVLGESDIIIAGTKEFDILALSKVIGSKPTLLIADGGPVRKSGGRTVVKSGPESIDKLLMLVFA
ncbi:MAG: hypothetical protein OK422_04040 [Thaumarchaeota archaeon]|nr:hypothetical protein [Nitrososphaerota archaeon]